MGLFDRFRKESVKDPFGGDGDDDFYEEDGEGSGLAGKGPKIALIASGVLFAGVVGFIGYVLLTAPEQTASAPVSGTFADLEVVEDGSAVPDGTGAAPVQDATAATDRSAERRPWLTAAPAPATGERAGMNAKAKPAAAKPAAPVPAAPAAVTPPTTAAVTPPAAKTPATPPAASAKPAPPTVSPPPAKETQLAALPPPQPSPTGAKPVVPAPAAAAKPEAAKPEAAKPEAAKPVPAKPEAVKPEAGKPEAAKPETAKPDAATDEIPSVIAGIPALNAPGVAPGAPNRFATSGDAGPALAGGRPRLVDPPLPPTDRVAVSAPPPRFAALRDQKKAEAVPPPAAAAKIAVVVHGLGLSASSTEAAITKLPAAVTLAFSPYGRNLKTWMDRAKAQGHEVLVEVPLESKEFPAQDPGPLGLLTTLEMKDNTERLNSIIKASNGAIGIFDAMGSKFRESMPHITPLVAALKEQNLFYVQGSPGVNVADMAVAHTVADVVIDERPFRAAIDARLDYAERLARYQGSAVAAMNAKPVSFERLVLWLEQAQKKGIALAPISAVLIRSEAASAPAAKPAPAEGPAAVGAKAKAKPAAETAKAKAKPAAETAKAKAKD